MKLIQASPSDPVSAQALRGFQEAAPILQDVEFYKKTGAADSVKKTRAGATTDLFRSLNASNTATPPTPTYEPATKRIVSFDAKVDVTIEDRNEDVEAELAMQTYLESRDAGFLFQAAMFEADNGSDADGFDGMRNKVSASQIVTPSAAVVLSLGNSDAHTILQQEAYESLMMNFAKIPGNKKTVYMNEYLKLRLITIAKALGFYRLSKDELGATVEHIGEVVIRGAGYDKDGTALLPLTETLAGHTTTSSIFGVSWGERVDLTMLTSVGLKGRYAGQSGNFITNNMNMDADLVLQKNKALWQFKGYALAPAA